MATSETSRATDPALRLPEAPAALRKRRVGVATALRYFGPGAIIASLTIGSGESILASREGAVFGYAVLWAVVVGCFAKGALVYASNRYITLTGEHPMRRFARVMPGPARLVPHRAGGDLLRLLPGLGQWCVDGPRGLPGGPRPRQRDRVGRRRAGRRRRPVLHRRLRGAGEGAGGDRRDHGAAGPDRGVRVEPGLARGTPGAAAGLPRLRAVRGGAVSRRRRDVGVGRARGVHGRPRRRHVRLHRLHRDAAREEVGNARPPRRRSDRRGISRRRTTTRRSRCRPSPTT